MQHFQKILVGVPAPTFDADGNPVADPPTESALHQAIKLARGTSASLTLMSVVTPPSAGFLTSDEENTRFAARILEEAEAALSAVVAGLDVDGIEIQTHVVPGEPWYELCTAVLRDGFDLVIAGTRNVSALRRLLFGGTGLRLLRNCPCPVWIVKPREDEDGQTSVLVASQLDDVGESLLSTAVSGSSILDAHVHVLHVIEYESARRLGMNADEVREYRERVKSERTELLQEQLSRTDHRTTPHGVQIHIAEGRPYVCILGAIAEHNTDLLVMGTLGRGGLPGTLVGNTAENLMNEVSCSILAIKPADFECPVKLDDQKPA